MMQPADQFTLLLVDDNPTNLLLLSRIIEMDLSEVRVLKAGSAGEGLELLAEEPVDGAFIDVQMPQMSGLEMCRELRKRPETAEIPLVLMTAHLASPEMRAEGLEVGAYDFISKPISNVEMLARVRVMLRMCAEDRRIHQSHSQLQQQLEKHSSRLRWISGLMISGDGPLKEQDQKLLRKLAGEIADPQQLDDKLFFEKMVTSFPLPWRRTILKLGLFDTVPLDLAQDLSEISDLMAVADYLNRHGLSLIEESEAGPLLIFTPRTREHLKKRAQKDLTPAERMRTYLEASDWFARNGDFPAALRCQIDAGEYAGAAQLISQRGLSLDSDRCFDPNFALLSRISEEVTAASGWLSLFRGLGELWNSSADAGDWLELAYQRFCGDGDQRGCLLTLAVQVRLSLFHDGCFERLRQRLPELRHLTSELTPLLEVREQLEVRYALGLAELFVAGNLSAVEESINKGLAESRHHCLLEQQLQFNILRSLQSLWQGRYLVAGSVLEQGATLDLRGDIFSASKVLGVAGCEYLHARNDLFAFEKQQELMLTQDGPGRLPQSILEPVMDYYRSGLYLARGENHRAAEILDVALLNPQVANQGHQLSRLLQLRGWINAMAGDTAAARKDLEKALDLRQQAGGELFKLENLLFAAATCFELQDFERAEELLAEGLGESRRLGEERLRPGLHAWMAVVQKQLGGSDSAQENLKLFFELLHRQRNASFWGMAPEILHRLQDMTSEPGHLKILNPIFENTLGQTLALDQVSTSEADSLPLLEIECLGCFRLRMGQQKLDLKDVGQMSRLILAQLCVIPTQTFSIESLMAILWPDSAPAKARNSFDTAHSRLRKALEGVFGSEIRKSYLVLEKGLLSLKNCRIDSSLFMQTMDRARYHLQREHFWRAEHAYWRMSRLWNGEFLLGHDLDGDLALLRDRLNQMRVDQICSLARLLKKQGRYEVAVEMLLQGVALDPTNDSVVRQLLELYRARQDNRSATLLLNQFRRALGAEDYAAEEIEELIESLDGQWLPADSGS